jgi:hypothetical protein
LSADRLPGESVLAFYFADQKPLQGPAALLDWRLNGQLTRMLLDGDVRGRAGEHVMLQSNGKFTADWVLFVGGGKWLGLSDETHASLVRHMVSVARQAGFRKLSLALTTHEEFNAETLKQQVTEAVAQEGDNIEVCLFSCDVPVVA